MNFLSPNFVKTVNIPSGVRYIILGLLIIAPLVAYVALQYTNVASILGVTLLLGFGVWTLFSFPSGLILLVAFLPLEPLLIKFIPSSLVLFVRLLPEVIILALFVSGLYKSWSKSGSKGNIISSDPILIPLLLFAGFAIISALLNQIEFVSGVVGFRQLFRFIILYQAVVLHGLSRKQILTIVGLVAALAVFESAVGLLQAWFGSLADNFLSTGRELFAGRFRVSDEIFQIRGEGNRVFAT